MSDDQKARREWLLERRTARRRIAEIRKEAANDTFIAEWLGQVDATLIELQQADLTSHEIGREAEAAGFRTPRAWLAAAKDYQQALRRFLEEDAFRALWDRLREHDERSGEFSYSSANGGVPSRLMAALARWHQAPKLTAAERKRHDKRVREICDELESLLLQVVPSHDLDDQYARFRFENVDQARHVFRMFGFDSDELESRQWPALGWHVGMRLAHSGVTPLWAIKNIRELARVGGGWRTEVLPRKVRAKSAKRTFFIVAVNEAITMATFKSLAELGISWNLLAEVVSLLADADCNSDDARRAIEGTSIKTPTLGGRWAG